MRTLLLAALLPATALPAGELPPLKIRAQTIDSAIQIGYGLAIADIDGDGRDDIALADARQIAWYRNPDWEKFVIAENLTTRDHVCIAARDLDGDQRAELAVGAEWNPNDTVASGAVFLLEPPADRTRKWTPRQLPHEPTTHRMAWVRDAKDSFHLAVLPLHGRGNRNAAGAGVEFHRYEWPWRETSQPVPLWPALPPLHATHNFDVNAGRAGETMLVATKEGVRAISAEPRPEREPQVVTTLPAGEVRRGILPGGGAFVTTIEPMHGNELAVYRAPPGSRSTLADWTSSRTVIDDQLVQGHALATHDLIGAGGDQIIVGWRGGGKPGAKVGIRLYAPAAADGSEWRLHTVIDDNTMACEDLKAADLDRDGYPEIIAAGRATRNVVIYWNEGARPASPSWE